MPTFRWVKSILEEFIFDNQKEEPALTKTKNYLPHFKDPLDEACYPG
jgi:hypothetical protein